VAVVHLESRSRKGTTAILYRAGQIYFVYEILDSVSKGPVEQ